MATSSVSPQVASINKSHRLRYLSLDNNSSNPSNPWLAIFLKGKGVLSRHHFRSITGATSQCPIPQSFQHQKNAMPTKLWAHVILFHTHDYTRPNTSISVKLNTRNYEKHLSLSPQAVEIIPKVAVLCPPPAPNESLSAFASAEEASVEHGRNSYGIALWLSWQQNSFPMMPSVVIDLPYSYDHYIVLLLLLISLFLYLIIIVLNHICIITLYIYIIYISFWYNMI